MKLGLKTGAGVQKPLSTAARATRVLFVFALLLLALPVSLAVPANVANAAGTIQVTDCTDQSGLSSAVATANADTGDIIQFTCDGTIPMTSSLVINQTMTIDANGHSVTLDGQNSVQLFVVTTAANASAGITFVLNGLTLTHGKAATDRGGAIYVPENVDPNTPKPPVPVGPQPSAVVVNNATFTGNEAPTYGGAIEADFGDLTVNNSTFTGSTVSGNGGAINNNEVPGPGDVSNFYKTTLSGDTFIGNSAADGGAIALGSNSPMSVTNSTFANNTATSDGDAIFPFTSVSLSFSTFTNNTGSGAGFGNSSGHFTLEGNILSNNGNGGVSNCNTSSRFTDDGYNLAYPNSSNCNFGGNSKVGDPQLGSLQNYGGPTQTLALGANSAAIGIANTCTDVSNSPVTTDQRGVARPSSACDAGAFQETPNNCPALPSYSSGFSSPACLTVTQGVNTTSQTTFSPPQNPPVANNVLSLTNGAGQGAGAFYDAPIDVTKPFTAKFDLVANGAADGATFTMQSANAGALGCNGGDLGVGYPTSGTCGIVSTIGTSRPLAAITPSVDAEFDLAGDGTGNCPSGAHVAFGVNGDLNDAARGNACYTQFGSVAHVWVTYDGSNLNLFISSTTTQPTSPTISFPSANLSSVLGSSAYFGFTGATGDSSAVISVNNWTLSQSPPTSAPAFTAGDNGAYTWGGATANPLVITGTAPAGSGVSLFSGIGCSGNALGTDVADGSGNWSIPVSGLATGPSSFSANASTPATGISACASPITVNVDRTAPSSQITFPSLTPNTPYLNASGWSAGCGTPAFGDICGTASDNSSGVAAVFVAIENSSGQFWNGTDFSTSGAWVKANGTTNWSLAVPRPTDGVYTVASAAIDNAGNTEAIFGKSLYGVCGVSGSGGQLSLNGGQLSLNGGLCTVTGTSGNSSVTGQLSLNGGQLSLNGGTGGQLSLNGGQLSLNGGQLSLNGGSCTVRDNTGTAGTLTITGGTLSSSGGQLSLNGGQLSLNGGLQTSGGQLSLNGGQLSLNGGLSVPNGGQLSLNGGDCSFTASGGNSGQLSLNGGQLSLNGGQLSLNGGQLSLNGGQLSLNGGQLSLNGGQLSLNGGAGASSELGNVVVDTTAPIASVQVDGQTQDNSVNINPGSTVHVSFNEAMVPTTITAANINLSPSANAPTCGSDTLCQNVTIDGLSSATTYTLTVSGATDLAGNSVTPLTFHFTTAASGPVANVDTDGDGIPDAWDGATVPLTGGRSINTGTWGFTPTTKDLCVVENYMNGVAADGNTYNQAISQAANQLIVNSFQRHGIHVVIFEGDAAHSAGLPSGYSGPYYGGSIDMTDPLGNVNNGAFDWRHGNSRNPVRGFEQIRSQNFVPTGLSQLCHYAVIAHSLGGTTSTGSSRGFDGSDFVTALAIGDGGVGNMWQQAGTVMHELGHNLGLHHGGAVSPSTTGHLPSDIDTNHKPNYLSVMNYNYQFTGVLQNTASANNQPCTVGGTSMYCMLDYSESALPPLNKDNLNETIGVGAPSNYAVKHECADSTSDTGFSNVVVLNGAGPVDWNCNSIVDPFLASRPESVNINADSNSGASTLNGYDDWDNLNFLVGTIGLGVSGTGAQGPEDDTSTIDVDPSESGGIDILGKVPEVSSPIMTASATVTWPTPSDITYGTALSGTQLNATSSVPGTITYSPLAGTVLNPGKGQTLTATFTPTDTTDFTTTTQTVQINDLYQQAGTTCDGSAGHQVLQPVNATGAMSVFKQGSTVPLKFRVCDASGNSVGPTSFAPSVVSTFGQTSAVSGTGSVNESIVSATADTSFRWDSSGQQWIYNLSTKSLSAGYTYTYTVTLNDGTQIPITFGLK